MQVNVDFIGRGAVQGNVASLIANMGRLDPRAMRPWIDDSVDANGRPSATFGKSFIDKYLGGDPQKIASYQAQQIQTNATLRRDEWKRLDMALQPYADFRLGGIADLVANNLVFDIGNGMGTTVLEWHDVSDAMEADLTMDGVTRSQGDRPAYNTNYLPLPIIHSDFEINARVLAASRNMGTALDTTGVERAGRRVQEKLESMLFTATSYTYGGGTIYSYLNEPNRNTVTLATAWDASAKTPQQILQDVRDMKQAAINARHYGPYMLYIPTAYETVLDDDYYTGVSDTTKAGTSDTIRDRILKVAGISGVKVIDTLTADNVLLVEMQSSTVRLVRGMALTNIEWNVEGGMVTKYKALTIAVPQVRADYDGHSGVVHLS